jgi:hypothetical protein
VAMAFRCGSAAKQPNAPFLSRRFVPKWYQCPG